MIRLILIDIDGTLVGERGVHPSSWDAIARARSRGVEAGLCTGRLGRGLALEYARRVSPEGFHVFQSGAVVSRPDSPAEYARVLPAPAVEALLAISRREREPLELYSERRFFLEFHSPLTRVHERHLGLEAEIADLGRLPEPVVRAQWVVDERDWPRFRALTAAIGGVDANPASAPWSPGTVFSNLTSAGTSKAAALRWLAGRLGLEASQVAMIGDGENDLDAMEAAGLGIAMGSAPEPVRLRATRVVASPDEGGLAEAIELALGT